MKKETKLEMNGRQKPSMQMYTIIVSIPQNTSHLVLVCSHPINKILLTNYVKWVCKTNSQFEMENNERKQNVTFWYKIFMLQHINYAFDLIQIYLIKFQIHFDHFEVL